MLQWTWECRALFEVLISFPLDSSGMWKVLWVIFDFLRNCYTVFPANWLYQFIFLPAVLNMYSLLRNLQTVFQSGSTILHHHHWGMRVLVDSRPYQHLVLSVLWKLAILKGMSWYLLVFLICSSLMVYDVEHLSICLFAISVSSSVRYLFLSFVHFLLDVSFLLINIKSSLYILD